MAHPPRSSRIPAGHVRFGSEEPIPPPSQPETIIIEDSSDNDSDAAPEDVSGTAALKEARESAAAAAKAAEEQQRRAKERRQEKELRLRWQAKTPKTQQPAVQITPRERSVSPAPPAVPDLESDEDDEEGGVELLPKELLQHDFRRSLTPPLESSTSNGLNRGKRKKLTLDDTPQDIQAGPTKVRVLEKTNKYLGPRTMHRSKDIREHWLQGRRSGNNIRGFQRVPLNPSFV